jgi:hypothetical protein
MILPHLITADFPSRDIAFEWYTELRNLKEMMRDFCIDFKDSDNAARLAFIENWLDVYNRFVHRWGSSMVPPDVDTAANRNATEGLVKYGRDKPVTLDNNVAGTESGCIMHVHDAAALVDLDAAKKTASTPGSWLSGTDP